MSKVVEKLEQFRKIVDDMEPAELVELFEKHKTDEETSKSYAFLERAILAAGAEEKKEAAIDQAFDELKGLPEEEFKEELKKHENSAVALALRYALTGKREDEDE